VLNEALSEQAEILEEAMGSKMDALSRLEAVEASSSKLKAELAKDKDSIRTYKVSHSCPS